MKFHIGTMTCEGGEGIVLCEAENGRLAKISVTGGLTDPIWCTRVGSRLFTTHNDSCKNGFNGSVSEYSVTDDGLRLTAAVPSEGDAPCHLMYDARTAMLYCANYMSGSLAVFPAKEKLGEAVQVIRHAGAGPDPVRQSSPHVHQVTFIPGTRYLAACDLGTDEIVTYAQAESGFLSEHSRTHLHGGPRHLAYGRPGIAYLAHELSNEVTVLAVTDGVFTPVQTLPTLPRGWTEKNTAAAVLLSPDGKRLFVSNRGHGSLAAYDVLTDGTLAFTNHLYAGIFPRDFLPLADGTFLVADQRAGVYLLDAEGAVLDFLPEPGAVRICMERKSVCRHK